MIVGSLFSGIGGIDLGLERAGMHIAWQCEIDPWCQRVLEKHWPSVRRYADIRSIDESAERVDVLAGGFPCQPVSLAGKGLAQADERWLWPEFARLVRLLRPRYVLVENVPGLLARGMGDVLGDLAACGYDAEWDSIGAADLGAPHRRKRVWIVAYPNERAVESRRWWRGAASAGEPDAPHATSGGREGWPHRPARNGREWPQTERSEGGDIAPRSRGLLADSEGEPQRPGLCEGEPRIFRRGRPGDLRSEANPWSVEPDVGRVAHGVPARMDRLTGLGNSVVPQVVEWIGRRMMEAEHG